MLTVSVLAERGHRRSNGGTAFMLAFADLRGMLKAVRRARAGCYMASARLDPARRCGPPPMPVRLCFDSDKALEGDARLGLFGPERGPAGAISATTEKVSRIRERPNR
jgi:hypothetical protein